MSTKIKKIVYERVKRILYIKSELKRIVGKSLFKNSYNTNNESLLKSEKYNYRYNRIKSISYFRLYCYISRSSKLVNKKYRLSRFGLNKEAKIGNIPNFIKKGW